MKVAFLIGGVIVVLITLIQIGNVKLILMMINYLQ